MTPFRPSQSVRLKDGSVGTIAELNPDGSYRVWFDKHNWKGDQSLIGKDKLVKINVSDDEMEA
jgi:uncharacterized protein YodC (DUF2158 family)